MGACCAPGAGAERRGTSPGRRDVARRATRLPGVGRDAVDLSGGPFDMGDDSPHAYPGDGEGPVHRVSLRPFSIDVCAVTNELFAAFVDDSGYVSDAERWGWAFVFGGLLPDDFPPTRGVAAAPWWRQVEGADWRHPEGAHSDLDGREDHPVVQVSWNDAVAYCTWAGCRLPTEAEWEYAARGGLRGAPFPWGSEREPGGEHRMNVWQGTFPDHDTAADGWSGTAPVDSYPPNGFGLHNMCGNTWEWCADWFDPRWYERTPPADPTGPARGTLRVMRGGSYLCHESYCRRYRTSARSGNDPEAATGNLGFRCVADV